MNIAETYKAWNKVIEEQKLYNSILNIIEVERGR